MSLDRPFRLRLIHFNDLHGRLADVTPGSVKPVFSRIAGFIRRARDECVGRSDAGVLVLAGGDDLVGGVFAELAGTRPAQFRCNPAYRLYSLAGVDARGIGNHDLDWGLGMLSLCATQGCAAHDFAMHNCAFPLLSANLRPAPWAQTSGILPSVVLTINGLRVAVIGLTTQGEIKHVFRGEFEIVDPIAAAVDLLPDLRAQSDLIVVLSHLGWSAAERGAVVSGMGDVELAMALPPGAAQVIVGSHTHTVLNEHGLDPANIINGALIVQAGSHGRYVGEVVIDVTTTGVEVVDARLWSVDSLPEDPGFESAHVLPLVAPVQELLAEPLGVVTPHDDLDPARVREAFASGESALANFVADAIAIRCRAAGLSVDFALVDLSTIGDGLPQEGPVTFGDLFRLCPHADSIVLLRLPPAQLQALLDDNARRVDLPDEAHEERGFVHFSREVRYRIAASARARGTATTTGNQSAPMRSYLHAVGAQLDGVAAGKIAATRDEPLLVACGSFLRQFALHWERRAREQGLAVLDLDALPHEVTGLALREELVAYVREMGGVTEAAGLTRDGRVSGP